MLGLSLSICLDPLGLCMMLVSVYLSFKFLFCCLCPPICLECQTIPFCLCICQSVCPSVYLSVCLSVSRSLSFSLYPDLFLFLYLSHSLFHPKQHESLLSVSPLSRFITPRCKNFCGEQIKSNFPKYFGRSKNLYQLKLQWSFLHFFL